MNSTLPQNDPARLRADGSFTGSIPERGPSDPGGRNGATPPDSGADLMGALHQAVRASKRIAELEWARIGLIVRRERRAVIRRVYEFLLILALGLAGTIALVRGILGGLSDLLDSPWGGQLLGGVLILGAAIAIPIINGNRRDKAHFESTKKKLCPTPRGDAP